METETIVKNRFEREELTETIDRVSKLLKYPVFNKAHPVYTRSSLDIFRFLDKNGYITEGQVDYLNHMITEYEPLVATDRELGKEHKDEVINISKEINENDILFKELRKAQTIFYDNLKKDTSKDEFDIFTARLNDSKSLRACLNFDIARYASGRLLFSNDIYRNILNVLEIDPKNERVLERIIVECFVKNLKDKVQRVHVLQSDYDTIYERQINIPAISLK